MQFCKPLWFLLYFCYINVFSNKYKNNDILHETSCAVSVVICVLSNVQDNRKPPDLTDDTKLRDLIAVYKRSKVCFLFLATNICA